VTRALQDGTDKIEIPSVSFTIVIVDETLAHNLFQNNWYENLNIKDKFVP